MPWMRSSSAWARHPVTDWPDEGNGKQGEQGDGKAIVVQETAHNPDLGIDLLRSDNASRVRRFLIAKAVDTTGCYI